MIDLKIQGDEKHWATDVDKEKGSFDYLMFVSSLLIKEENVRRADEVTRLIVSIVVGTDRSRVELILNYS